MQIGQRNNWNKWNGSGPVPVVGSGTEQGTKGSSCSTTTVPVPGLPIPHVCSTQSVPLDSHPWRHRNNRIPTPVAKLLLVGLLWLLWAVCCPNCCWGAV